MPNYYNRIIKFFLFGLVLITAFGLANFLYVEKSFAGVSDNVSGYAWSSNIGFISFNSANAGNNAKGNYGVNIDPTTGELSGYAWSSNIGFISFNKNHFDLPKCPSGECVAKLDLTNNKLTGWAKTASSVLAGSDSGWIRLSGLTYGVNYDTNSGEFSGLAWGGDLIGWIKFKSLTGLYGVTTNSNIGKPDAYPQLKIVPLSTINLTSGKTTQVQVYYYTSNTSSENVTSQAQWSSGNSSLVSIPPITSGASNTITAANGITLSQSTTISVSYGGKTATRIVNVEPPVIIPTLIVSEDATTPTDIFAVSKVQTINMLQNDFRVVYAYVDKDGDGYNYSPENVSGSAVWTISNNPPSISISGSSSKQIKSDVGLGRANIDVVYTFRDNTGASKTLPYPFEVNVTDFYIQVSDGGGGGTGNGNIEDETKKWLEENKTDKDATNDNYEAIYQASTETISAGTIISGKGIASYKDTCSNLGYPNFWWNYAITLYRLVAFYATNPNSNISSWSWNFGEQALPKTATTNPASTKFLSVTTKTIVLKAFDSDGDYCKRTKTILIGGRGEE